MAYIQNDNLTGVAPYHVENSIITLTHTADWIIAVHDAENEGDDIHHRFLAQLFECGFDAFDVIKWKELYEIVEQAIDCCEDVANIVHGIVLKNV